MRSALQTLITRIRMCTARSASRIRREDGDVPGWVLVTLMTAGIVVALWAVASPLLTGLFEDAVRSVTGP